MPPYRFRFILILILTTALLTAEVTAMPSVATLPNGDIATPQNFKVAFIGDSDDGQPFQDVLDLIVAEEAQFVLHQGDFAYSSNISTWEARINDTLGATFPLSGPDGNHDDWAIYVPFFKARLDAMGISPNPLEGGEDDFTFAYQGLKIVFSQQGGNPAFIESSLTGDNHIWKICGWHYNMNAMQIGGKSDQQGWGDYETCREQGALIVTGHEHSYERTRTLTNMMTQIIDVACPDDPNTPDADVCVSPGRSLTIVSGLGGRGMRDQNRCLPYTYPYGCQGEWAKVYTTDQTPNGEEQFGALFITFYVDDNPYKARAYFKNTLGEVIDSFDIYATSDAMPNLSIALANPKVSLGWQDLGDHIDHYEVWRSDVPYFAVGGETAVNLNNNIIVTTHGTPVIFNDSTAGSDSQNYFYLVEIVGVNNQTTFNEVGKFNYPIIPGSS